MKKKKTKLLTAVRFKRAKKGVPTIPLVAIGTQYNLRGADIKATIDALGKTQTDLSTACGYKSKSRICYLANRAETEVSSDTADTIARGIRKLGGDVAGLVELVK